MYDVSDEPDRESYPPISALNDYLFCSRRCALHRVEQIWQENRHTLEGTAGHKRAHAEPSAEDVGAAGQIVRGIWVWSDRLRLIGKTDVVELRPDPYPIEYKRGRRRRWDNDDVQLCAQALCLEEMLGAEIAEGAIYHVKSKRRRVVRFDQKLRELTMETARRVNDLLQSGLTPPPIIKKRCSGCSLLDVCMPHALSHPADFPEYNRLLYSVSDVIE